jgi:hypothetical protein
MEGGKKRFLRENSDYGVRLINDLRTADAAL